MILDLQPYQAAMVASLQHVELFTASKQTISPVPWKEPVKQNPCDELT